MAVALLGLIVIAVAVTTSVDELEVTQADPTPGSEAILPIPYPHPPAEPEPSQRQLPRVVRCVDVRVPDCLMSVRSSLDLLTALDPHVREATARTGIICSSTLDCPPDRLRRMVRPIATVTLRFDDGSGSAWINVVESRRGRPMDAPPRFRAWLVRWVTSSPQPIDP